MANHGGARSSSAGNNESLIIGILVGMVLGLAAAGGVAWYLAKKPSMSPINAQPHDAKPVAEAPKPAPAPATVTAQTPPPIRPAPPPAPSAAESKQRFEFYRILTDKQESESHSAPKTAPSRPAPNSASAKPVTAGSDYFLQAGSFSTAEDADKLKARIAMAGMEATVQTANVPEKGVRYRVRLGPYRSTEEMNKAVALLKQNGIADTAPVRAQ